MSTGTIFNIQRFCTDDGPGIRTTVFLKGCPLRCIWCHNPESQALSGEILLDAGKCIRCGRCASVCQSGCHSVGNDHSFDRSDCIACGACVKACPTKALELCGAAISVEQAYGEIVKDRIFYETSGGGVTVSGGEPLFQAEFTAELLQKCKENQIHTAIETCGFANEASLLSVIAHCDLILFDIKDTDPELHKRNTGVSLTPILRNLELINRHKIPFIIRAPIIPTLNDRESHLKALKSICDSMEYCQGIQIMPYHKIGSHKYQMLNRSYACKNVEEPSEETVKAWSDMI